MAIHRKYLETIETVIATALNIVKNRPLADLYVRKHVQAAQCRHRLLAGFSALFEVGGAPPFLEIEAKNRTRSARRVLASMRLLHAVVVTPMAAKNFTGFMS
jgi:hypothetical protein